MDRSVLDDFKSIDQLGSWIPIYQKIKQDCVAQHDFSVKDAKRPEFKGRNRYRDVSPYDHNRIKLQRNNVDYINASLVHCPHVNRSYILTQGPLPNTAGHFWLMVWEYDSQAVLMLNRVIEKGQIKCHQYFPTGIDDNEEMIFEDVGLKVIFVSEETANYFSIRTLELEDIETGIRKRVLQFHYTTWPDFGVPNSPKAFLEFLFAVRAAGVLDSNVGPPVIHCSAGIGRSGTFCLVDTCLVLIEKEGHANQNVCDLLIEMRKSRMGLIQTADQLRFSYLAIIEGYKDFLHLDISSDVWQNNTESFQEGSVNEEIEADEICTSNVQETYHTSVGTHNNNNQCDEYNQDVVKEMKQTKSKPLEQEIKRRKREERKKKTSEQIAKMKRKQKECETWKIRQNTLQPYLWGLSVAVLVGSCIVYQCYSQ